jgi:hypothetical protein
MHKVPVGPTTVLGGGVTLASFAAAVVAFALGARDEGTIGPLVIGGVSLVTTLVGRYAQAVAATKAGVAPLTYGTGSLRGEGPPPRQSRKKG